MATTHDPLASATGQTESTANSLKDKASEVKERLTGAASHLRDTASDYGQSAADQLDRQVRGAAGALENTANTLRSQGSGGFTESAASKLQSTADMLKNYDTRQLLSQFENWTRSNPGIAIGGALAVGFFIGMSLKRDDRY